MDKEKAQVVCRAAETINRMVQAMVGSREMGRKPESPQFTAALMLAERLVRVVEAPPPSALLVSAYRTVALMLHDLMGPETGGITRWAALIERFAGEDPDAHLALGVLAYGRRWAPGVQDEAALPEAGTKIYDETAVAEYETAERLYRRRQDAGVKVDEDVFFQAVFYQVEALRNLGEVAGARAAWHDAYAIACPISGPRLNSWWQFRLAEEAMRLGLFDTGGESP